MKFRMDKTLNFWIDAEINGVQIIDDPDANPNKLRRALLGEFEANGYAARRVDRNGTIVWQATPALHQYLKDCELDAFEDAED